MYGQLDALTGVTTLTNAASAEAVVAIGPAGLEP
jgi:hypothetical protein